MSPPLKERENEVSMFIMIKIVPKEIKQKTFKIKVFLGCCIEKTQISDPVDLVTNTQHESQIYYSKIVWVQHESEFRKLTAPHW